MNNKDLKKLAKQIADLEIKLTQTSNEEEKNKIEKQIMLMAETPGLELLDFCLLDDMIQEIIELDGTVKNND